MTDLLDRVRPAALDLLGRVDAGLVGHGAPAGDPVWPELRRVGALPGEAVARLAEVLPGPLAAAGEPLRSQARGYRAVAASVPAPAAWRGPAADGYAHRWAGISDYLAGDLADRLDGMAAYADEVTGWLGRARTVLAGSLAECLGSVEAAVVRAGPAGSGEVVRAGAAIGAHVLGTVADLLDDAGPRAPGSAHLELA